MILADFLVPEDGKPNWTRFVDLLMLGELTGNRRTKTEFGDLLIGADFKLDRVIDTDLTFTYWKHLWSDRLLTTKLALLAATSPMSSRMQPHL